MNNMVCRRRCDQIMNNKPVLSAPGRTAVDKMGSGICKDIISALPPRYQSIMDGNAVWEQLIFHLESKEKDGGKMSDTKIMKVTAVAEPRPDGAKITKAVIVFHGTLPEVSSIEVKDRKVLNRIVDGNTITLVLDEQDQAAEVFPQAPGFGKAPGSQPGGPGQGKPGIPSRFVQPVKVIVEIPNVGVFESTGEDLGVMGKFVQGKQGKIYYNLYTPENIEPGKQYPIVMFIPDASVNGDNPLAALAQGIGATIWAMPEEQAKRPCFVLAIQVPKEVHLTGGNAQLAPEIHTIKDILDRVIAENPIDPNRVYTTGQSQGCMASCGLNLMYPDFFAASLLVAGQWDDPKMGTLVNHKFFIGVSSGGPREYPGMNRITSDLAANGAKVKRIDLNYRDGFGAIDCKVRAEQGDANIVYCVFDKDTIFPDDGKERVQIMHHNRGWELTYQMESAREWIFAQSK